MPRVCAATSVLLHNIERHPEIMQRQARMRNAMSARVAVAEAPVPRDIPVVVHILYKDPADNLPDAQILSQIDVLNEDFNNANADLSTVPDPFKPLIGNPGISFHLAEGGITRNLVEVDEFPIDDDHMKRSSTGGVDGWDPNTYLNIWVCRLTNGTLGYAQFPDSGPPETDGVVIIPGAFGLDSALPNFNLGRTATHEVGHYLGLYHIWGNSFFDNCIDDDEVDDTPVQRGPNVDKPSFPVASCPGQPNGDMFMNFMDYVDDDTMVMFSAGQVARMHAALAISRPGLGIDRSRSARLTATG